jgi:superfamily II DNA or RNA helicase
MLSKSISAPVGAGITRFVSENATEAANGRPIVVIAHLRELRLQWARYLPQAADIISVHQFACHGCDPRALIIVGEMHTDWLRKILLKLSEAENEVWLVNMPLPRARCDMAGNAQRLGPPPRTDGR